jgi:regulator of RNase E activity RraB
VTGHSDNATDEQVLQHLAETGSDLSQPMLIDFQVAADDEASANRIAAAAAARGFETQVYFDEEFDDWICECSQDMIAAPAEIAATEARLDEIAAPFGGRVDGWGSFGNGDEDFDDEDEGA